MKLKKIIKHITGINQVELYSNGEKEFETFAYNIPWM